MTSAAALVFVAALATAVATGLGALPFAVERWNVGRWLGPANAVASGVMLGASASLLFEGVGRSGGRTIVGALAGAAFVHIAYRAAGDHHTLTIGALRGAEATKALLIVGVMTAHSAAEGIGVGASFGDGHAFGLLIAAAIAVQNIPEGLAISLVLVPLGTRVRTAAGVEHLLEPPAGVAGGAGVSVRRAIASRPADRARLCRRRDDLDGRPRVAARGAGARAENGGHRRRGRVVRADARAPVAARGMTDRLAVRVSRIAISAATDGPGRAAADHVTQDP